VREQVGVGVVQQHLHEQPASGLVDELVCVEPLNGLKQNVQSRRSDNNDGVCSGREKGAASTSRNCFRAVAGTTWGTSGQIVMRKRSACSIVRGIPTLTGWKAFGSNSSMKPEGLKKACTPRCAAPGKRWKDADVNCSFTPKAPVSVEVCCRKQ
jgi:hypothetical protein